MYQSCSGAVSVTIWVGEFFVVGAVLGSAGCQAVRAFLPLPTRCQWHSLLPLFPPAVTAKNVSRHCQMSLESKIALVEKPRCICI